MLKGANLKPQRPVLTSRHCLVCCLAPTPGHSCVYESMWVALACKSTDDALVPRMCFSKRAPDKSRSRGEESPLSDCVRRRSTETRAVNPVTQREIQLP